jgi:hypothetical protein
MTSLGAAQSAAIPASKRFAPLRFIDWIWRIRGSVPLVAEQTSEDAFGKLAPLFEQAGTTRAHAGDTLTFQKKNQLAQDKMSVFDSGVLHIEQAAEGPVLRYSLVSRALLFCFLAPLLFLGVAQLTLTLGEYAKPTAAEKAKAEAKEKAKKKGKDTEIKLNPVDKFLGAPAPEKPKDEKADGKKADAKKAGDKKKDEEDEAPKGFSPTPAYVFAGIFAALYVLGRILEAWLIRRLFQRTLA